MKLTSRIVYLPVLSSLLVFGLSSAAQAGDITVMGYRSGGFQENYIKVVIEPFEKVHPDIKVNYYGVQNAAFALGVMRAQKSAPQVDAVIFDLSVAKLAKEEGLITEASAASIPNSQQLGNVGRELGNYALPITYDTYALIYNKAKFATPPDTWNSLWDADFKGKVVIPAQGGGDIQAIALTLITNHMAGQDDYKISVKPGVKRLVELAPSVQTWEPKPDQYTLVANGTAQLGVGWNARSQFYIDLTEGRVATTLPKEGSVMQVNVISPLAGTNKLKDTEVFINYALSAEAQQRFAELMYYAPTNQQSQLSDSLRARIPLLDVAHPPKILPVDWVKVASSREDLLRPWRREIIPASR